MPPKPSKGAPRRSPSRRKPPYMTNFVTCAVLMAALIIILVSSYDESTKRWAFGTVGTILGYWLHGMANR